MKGEDNFKKRKIVSLIIVFLILAFVIYIHYSPDSLNIFKNPVSQSDISLSNFKYESNPPGELPFHYDPENKGVLITEFSLIINTQRNDLYVKAYDSSDNEINGYITGGKLNKGDNKYFGMGSIINSLGDSPQLKICVYTNYQFTENTPGVVCKIQSFNPPNLEIQVTPDPITFTINKSSGNFQSSQQVITVTNIGNIVAPSDIFISSYVSTDPAYQTPKSYPQILSQTNTFISWLKPGESYNYPITASIGNVGDFDTPLDNYNINGYVYGISSGTSDCPVCTSLSNSLFKKQFTVKVIVTS